MNSPEYGMTAAGFWSKSEPDRPDERANGDEGAETRLIERKLRGTCVDDLELHAFVAARDVDHKGTVVAATANRCSRVWRSHLGRALAGADSADGTGSGQHVGEFVLVRFPELLVALVAFLAGEPSAFPKDAGNRCDFFAKVASGSWRSQMAQVRSFVATSGTKMGRGCLRRSQ